MNGSEQFRITILQLLSGILLFIGSLWLSLSFSLIGGLVLLTFLSDVGFSKFIDGRVGGALGLLGLPVSLLLLSVFALRKLVPLPRSKLKTAATIGLSGAALGSAIALVFLLAGGWGGMFG